MTLPKFLQKYKQEAKTYLEKGLVRDIEFSGPTYQVQVYDPSTKKEEWAFLQLDPKGWIQDSFCSCEEGDKCIHLATAYLRVFNNGDLPLHERFQRSLWNKLCFLFTEHCGDDPSLIQEIDPDHYVYKNETGDTLFFVKTKNQKSQKRLWNMLFNRTRQTEENSLKFSNLSEDEIALWRQGRPNFELKYELSFWNDLAKWLFLMQDEGTRYSISFRYSEKEIPNEIIIKFPSLEVGFTLAEANLSFIIPALATVKSPLSIHQVGQESMQKITYDKVHGELLIKRDGMAPVKEEKGVTLNDWVFVPGDGFYSRTEGGGLQQSRLSGEMIAKALTEQYGLIKSRLEHARLHLDPVHVSYDIRFDDQWNFHIAAYLFAPGDLSTQFSKLYGDWAYLEDDGFYPVEGLMFDAIETVIPVNKVSSFVREQRTWLGHHTGFETHITGIETQLTYLLSPQGVLRFIRKVAFEESSQEIKDFGEWVYVKGEGFFSKTGPSIPSAISHGMVISSDQVPLFIHQHHEELQLIPGFFSSTSPIEKGGVRVEVKEDQSIEISPEYKIFENCRNKSIRFFDDFVYVEGEGFHELSGSARLPEPFRHLVHIPEDKTPDFVSTELNIIKQFVSYLDPRLVTHPKLELKAKSIVLEDDKYQLRMDYFTEAGQVKFINLWRAIQGKKPFLFSEAGLIDLKDSRFHPLRFIVKKQVDLKSNIVKLSTMELLRLLAFEKVDVQEGKELIDDLMQGGISSQPNLTGMGGTLRPYQINGVHWLWHLFQHNLSGLLCDDMGLGKTHQAMALLSAVRNRQQAPSKFLIICPTSVIYHWEEKLLRYLPELRVCTFHGTGRTLEEHEVLLTSYGIWRREHKFLSQFNFDVAVFDEIQSAKNPGSILFNSLMSVKSKMKLGLTGTPIENRLHDVKALFDIVLPNYMPSESEFKALFVTPIERDRDKARQGLLSRFIKPFIIRRKKSEVLFDLPEKVEEIAHCDLSYDQANLYNEVLIQMREGIVRDLKEGVVSYIHIFAVLSALKQICNHPAAYLKKPEEYKNFTSGKWDLFVELLNEARESQQKVVIFSQYLSMLDIMEAHLDENNIEFATIRGSTLDRGKQVERFNKDPKCEVFLGSLQAAGWGIDLTAASVVIHYDRWWNAAREDQATDRVHRIGQTRGVQVFKLVTKNTFEERIDNLIEQKGKLMEDVIGFDDHQFVKKFSQEEILQLLQEVKIND